MARARPSWIRSTCVALLHKGISLSGSCFPDIETDPAFSRIRGRITLRTDPDLDREQPNGRGAVVTITVVDGTTATRRVDHPRGYSLRAEPTWPELADKWRDALDGVDTDAWIRSAARLDNVVPFIDQFTGIQLRA